MEAQLYQVSYLGATYYAVPVYYPGSFTFKSWYLIAYVDGRLNPYTVVSGSAVIILYNPYFTIGLSPSPTPNPTPTPTPAPPGSGVFALNGLTGNLAVIGVGGIMVTSLGSTLTITGASSPTDGLTQAEADLLYVKIPAPSPGIPASTPADPFPQYLTFPEGDVRYLKPAAAIPGTPGVPGTPAGTLSDPFPIYLTKTEGDGLYEPLGTPGTPSPGTPGTPGTGITQAQADARYIQIPSPSPGVPASTPSDPLPIYLRSSEVVAPVLIESTAIAPKQFLASPASSVGGLTTRAIALSDLPAIPGSIVNQNVFKVKQVGNQSLPANTYTALTNWVAVYNPNSIINLSSGDFSPTETGLYTLTVNGIVNVTAPYSTENVIAIALYENGTFLELFSIVPLLSSVAGFVGQCVFLATASRIYSVRVSPTKNISVVNSGGFFTNMGLIPAY